MKLSLIVCVLATTSMMVVSFVQAREFHVTVDFNDDFRKAGGPVKPQNIDNLMARFSELGIRRVYWIHNAEDHYLARPLTDPKVDLIECAVEAAHRHGMKLYALYKPFETGRVYASISQSILSPNKNRTIEAPCTYGEGT